MKMDIFNSTPYSDITTRRAAATQIATSGGANASKVETDLPTYVENRFGNAVAEVRISQRALDVAKTSAETPPEVQEPRDDFNGILTKQHQEHLERIVNDEEYAKEQAMLDGAYYSLVPLSSDLFSKDDGPIEDWALAVLKHLESIQDSVFEKRRAFYQSQVEEGTPAAQIYANLMEYNANLGQDFWDPTNTQVDHLFTTTEHFQAEHNYLQKLLDEKAAA